MKMYVGWKTKAISIRRIFHVTLERIHPLTN